jgi:hypothetical protein
MPSNNSADAELILTPSEAAKYLGLAKATLAKCRCWGGGPPYLKLGRKIAYRRFDLDEWLVARRARNTSDAARLPPRLADANAAQPAAVLSQAKHPTSRQKTPRHTGAWTGDIGVLQLTKHCSTHSRVAASRAHAAPLPLFAWADSRPQHHQSTHLPRAARLVASRFGLAPSRARIIAELAGFVLEAA